jgi:hypothetical protein
MAQPKLAANLFFVAAAVFLLVSVLPVVRGGGSLNATYLALGIVFLTLGIANLKKSRGRG